MVAERFMPVPRGTQCAVFEQSDQKDQSEDLRWREDEEALDELAATDVENGDEVAE